MRVSKDDSVVFFAFKTSTFDMTCCTKSQLRRSPARSTSTVINLLLRETSSAIEGISNSRANLEIEPTGTTTESGAPPPSSTRNVTVPVLASHCSIESALSVPGESLMSGGLVAAPERTKPPMIIKAPGYSSRLDFLEKTRVLIIPGQLPRHLLVPASSLPSHGSSVIVNSENAGADRAERTLAEPEMGSIW